MKLLAIIAAAVAAAAASPAGAVSEHQPRRITARVSLCSETNLQGCDVSFIPIDSCTRVKECQVHSLSTGGHICDFYSKHSCGGSKYKYDGIQQDLSESIHVRSVWCW